MTQSQILLIIGLATSAAFTAGLLAWLVWMIGFSRRSRLERRIAAVLSGYKGKQSFATTMEDGSHAKRKIIQGKLKIIEAARQKRRLWQLRESLLQAGLELSVPQALIIAASLIAIIASILAVLQLPILAVIFIATTGGVGVPKIALSFLARRRLAKFTRYFADAVDIVVRGVKSGLPIGECVAIIAREMPDPVGKEFRTIAEEQRLGLSLEEALNRAVERMPTQELKFFAIVLIIQQQTGGNLADTLSKLSDVLRSRKKMRDKVQAMSSEAKASASIIGSLPILVACLLGVIASDYVGLLFTTSTGHWLLGFGCALMTTGILVMRQMIHFDM